MGRLDRPEILVNQDRQDQMDSQDQLAQQDNWGRKDLLVISEPQVIKVQVEVQVLQEMLAHQVLKVTLEALAQQEHLGIRDNKDRPEHRAQVDQLEILVLQGCKEEKVPLVQLVWAEFLAVLVNPDHKDP
jgi:hypothetical protein